MPGTAFVMGVRKLAGGAITSRSICGVNANGGSPGKELLAGVVAGLAVVRSVLSKQAASAILVLSGSSKRSHRVAAELGMLPEAKTVRATMFNRNTRERYMQVPHVFHVRRTRRTDLGSARLYQQSTTTVDRPREGCSPAGGPHALGCALAAPIDHWTHAEHVPEPAVEGREVAEAGLKRDRRHRLG